MEKGSAFRFDVVFLDCEEEKLPLVRKTMSHIRMVEYEARKICPICGGLGELVSTGALRFITRCKKHEHYRVPKELLT
jgi:hypothetical protein